MREFFYPHCRNSAAFRLRFVLLATLALAGCEVGTQTLPRTPYITAFAKNSTITSSSTGEIGTAIPVTVTIKDQGGYGVVGVTPSISAISAAGSTAGISSGGCGSTNGSGVATCSIQSSVLGTFTLKVTSPVSASGNTITFVQLPRFLTFTVQPAAAAVSLATWVGPTITVLDKLGTAIPSGGTVSLALTSANGAILTGASAVAAAGTGIADFSAQTLAIDKSGTYTLTASLTNATVGTITGTSSNIVIGAGVATKLVFAASPTTSVASGVAFIEQPIINVTDAYGNTVTSNNTCVVNLTLTGGDPLDTLYGSVISKTVTSGVANFASPSQILHVDRNGPTATPISTYVLQATGSAPCGGLTAATSADFTVTFSGRPYQLSLMQGPSTAALNETWSSQPKIGVMDVNGNLVTGDNTTVVTLALASGGGGTMVGSANIQVVNGIAQFSAMKITGTAGMGNTTYTYNFSGTNGALAIGSLNGVTQTITENGLTPSKLAFSIQPQSVAINERMTAVVVNVVDANGFLCFNDNSSQVKFTYDTAFLPGTGKMQRDGLDQTGVTPGITADVTVINGKATISGLSFTTSGTKVIQAFGGTSSPGLTLVRSNNVGVSDFTTADNLKFKINPADIADGICGVPWTTQPTINVLDKYGNLVTNDNSTVITIDCVAPLTTPACALTGTTSVRVTSGVAAFTDLRLLTPTSCAADVTGVVIRAQSSPALNAGFSATFIERQ